jgi:hypothetical protein
MADNVRDNILEGFMYIPIGIILIILIIFFLLYR